MDAQNLQLDSAIATQVEYVRDFWPVETPGNTLELARELS